MEDLTPSDKDSGEEGGAYWGESTRTEDDSTWKKRMSAKRMIRAVTKIADDTLRDTPKESRKPKKEDPEQRIIRVYVTLEDGVGTHHLRHRVGKMEELEADVSKGPVEPQEDDDQNLAAKPLRGCLDDDDQNLSFEESEVHPVKTGCTRTRLGKFAETSTDSGRRRQVQAGNDCKEAETTKCPRIK
jgi:hypothetical protein